MTIKYISIVIIATGMNNKTEYIIYNGLLNIIIKPSILYTDLVLIYETEEDYCGCKNVRPCYKKMLDELLMDDEDACVENVGIGASTVTIFLKALKTYCDKIVVVNEYERTFEGKILYEVVLSRAASLEVTRLRNGTQTKPIILLEAGQDAGSETVGFALYIIEQLVACSENKEMLKTMTWVILPSTNPDGQEYSRNSMEWWQKNYRPLKDKLTHGVDITKNFDESFGACPSNENIFSQNYPGPNAKSEVESRFVTNVLKNYSTVTKAYVSLRRNGHAILYPFASRNVSLALREKVQAMAGEIAKKVNQRAGGMQSFVNQSILSMNGKPQCGHSVDYAYAKLSIPITFEMRIFPEVDNHILSQFQALPKGYDITLRTGYFSGIRELYNLLVDEHNNVKPYNI